IAIDLLLILRRRLVLDARRQTILRLLRLELLRQRRLDPIERGCRLLAHVLPFREVLLEGLGSRRRQGHALAGEGEAGAAASEVRIVAAHFVQQIFGFLEATRVFVAQAREVGAAGGAAARLALTRAAGLAGRALRRRLTPVGGVLLPELLHLAADRRHPIAQLLRALQL